MEKHSIALIKKLIRYPNSFSLKNTIRKIYVLIEKHSTTNVLSIKNGLGIRKISVLMEKHSTTNALIIKNGFGIRKIYVLIEKHPTTNAFIIKTVLVYVKFLFSWKITRRAKH